MLVCFSLWRIRGKYICAAHWSWEQEGGSVAHFGPDFLAVQCVCTSKVRDIASGLCTDPLDPKEATAARSFGYFVFLETIPTLSVGKCRSLRSSVLSAALLSQEAPRPGRSSGRSLIHKVILIHRYFLPGLKFSDFRQVCHAGCLSVWFSLHCWTQPVLYQHPSYSLHWGVGAWIN